MTTTETQNEVALPVSRSVVAPMYKALYREKASTAKLPKNVDRKVIARSCGDWLAKTLAPLTVGEKRKANRPAFAAILEANGIDHAAWAHLDNGRFRMTGGKALRTVVACNEGKLVLADGNVLTAPKSWVAIHAR
jgi:hypothetical protein